MKIIRRNTEEPYLRFYNLLDKAQKISQSLYFAACISSYDKTSDEVNSRYVNIKYIDNEEWIFFSNYNSTKAIEFHSSNKISVVFLWNRLNIQIRMKAKIKKTDSDFSDKHFAERSIEKNALAISSYQSQEIDSYQEVESNYKQALQKRNFNRPEYWGGYSFKPYSFEFWEGNENRLNKRVSYERKNNEWSKKILQP